MPPSLFVTEGDDGVDGKGAACGNVAGGEGGESEKGCDHEISHWIAGADAEEQTGHCTGGKECDCRTEDEPDASETHATSDEESEDIPSLGTERSAHTDFMDTFGDGVAHDAVNSHERKYEGERAKGADEPKCKASCGKSFGDDLFHGTHVVHGKLGVQLGNNSSHSGEERGVVASAANRESHIGPRILREGQVTFALGRFGEAIVQNVADDADHFKLLFAKNVKVLAEWILTRPDDLGEFLVDDDNGIGCSGVGSGEFTSAKQRNAHGMKVPGIDGVNADHRALGALKGRTPFGGGDSRGRVVAFKRKIIGDSDPFNPRQRGNAIKKLVEKLRGTGVFGVPDAGEVHPHCNHVIGVEAGFYLQDLNEAADEKSGSDEKNERQ